jgi:hypothetical protein
MPNLVSCVAASLLTVALACDSTAPLSTSMPQTSRPTTTTQGSGGDGAAGTAGSVSMGASGGAGAGGATVGPGTGGSTQPGGASACDQPTGDPLRPASIAALQQTIRGTWQLCSNVGLFHQPQSGMFIGPDDRYVFLELVGGKLVPKTGLENKGHLEYIDTSLENGPGAMQVNFVSDLDLTTIAGPPIFSDVPRQLIINIQGIETYTYAAVAPDATIVGDMGAGGTTGAGGFTGAAGVGGQSSVASGCDRPTGDRLFTSSVADVQATIRRTWLLCSSVGLFHQPQAGMVIGSDDTFAFLDLVGGKLVPKAGPGNTGHVEYIDTSSVNGPGSIDVSFVNDMGFSIGSPPIFSDDPRQLIISNAGAEFYTYGAVP